MRGAKSRCHKGTIIFGLQSLLPIGRGLRGWGGRREQTFTSETPWCPIVFSGYLGMKSVVEPPRTIVTLPQFHSPSDVVCWFAARAWQVLLGGLTLRRHHALRGEME